jgi:YidC/Oxa1 family membrane protein insertase
MFDALLYTPLYNGLIFLIDVVPTANVGFAVILLTVIVKLVLFPLSLKAVKTQIAVRALEPELNTLKEKYKDDKQEQARKLMELYRENKVNPFSGFLVILIQLPIIFALYWVFFRGGLPVVDVDKLYSFVPKPEMVNMHFLWVADVSAKSVALAILVGITQFVQIKLTLPPMKKRTKNGGFKEDLARSFQIQMRYVMPFIAAGAAYIISAAIALYWTTSNVFAIGQELFVRHRWKRGND